MAHTPEFLALVEDAKTRVQECSVEDLRAWLDAKRALELVDVREDHEFAAAHARASRHVGRGVLERDVIGLIPDKGTRIVLYCGGGFRSALAADNLRRMGYTDVWSLAGGVKALMASGFPME